MSTSTAKPHINAQTVGPLHVAQRGRTVHERTGIAIAEAFARGTETPDPEANARLLAASYTAFDRAGRELGIDAATLAESIDLAALIVAARDVKAEHGMHAPPDDGHASPLDAAIYRLAHALPRVTA